MMIGIIIVVSYVFVINGMRVVVKMNNINWIVNRNVFGRILFM